MNRRDWLRRAAVVATGAIAADQLEILDRLGWRRTMFPAGAMDNRHWTADERYVVGDDDWSFALMGDQGIYVRRSLEMLTIDLETGRQITLTNLHAGDYIPLRISRVAFVSGQPRKVLEVANLKRD